MRCIVIWYLETAWQIRLRTSNEILFRSVQHNWIIEVSFDVSHCFILPSHVVCPGQSNLWIFPILAYCYMMKGYTLAVIIPCWNCESYVGELLNCLLNQTFSDWEAFFVDDGCADSTGDVIRKFAARDGRIKYVQRERGPKGAPTCRNIGFDLSQAAKYVIFLDADDLIAPYCFEQRVDYLQNHSQLDFAVFPAKAFKHSIFDETALVYGVRFIADDLQAMLNWNLPMIVCTNIYKRQALVDYALKWDENLLSLQDSDFNIQAMVKGMHYEYADGQVDYFYRRVDSGITKKIRTEQHYHSHIYMLEKTLNSVSSSSLNYDFFLGNHVLLFMDLMRGNLPCLKKITQLSWMRKHWLFRCKLVLLILFRFRGKKHLFKKEVRYSKQMTSRWIEFMKVKAESIRNDGSMNLFAV